MRLINQSGAVNWSWVFIGLCVVVAVAAVGAGWLVYRSALAQDNLTTLKVYFSNTQFEPVGIYDCSLVYPVPRTIRRDAATSSALLGELFKGPTADELARGYHSPFSFKTKDILANVRLDRGVAYVNLIDLRGLIPNVSSACGGQQFKAQVEATLEASLGVERVVYAINGQPSDFYEWLQLDCAAEDACAESNFE